MTKFTEITEMRGESKELKGVSRKNSGNDINGSKLDRWEWYGIISVKLATNYIGVNNKDGFSQKFLQIKYLLLQ